MTPSVSGLTLQYNMNFSNGMAQVYMVNDA